MNKEKLIEEEEEVSECTKTIGNEILFYGDITPENTLEFVEAFKKLEIHLLKQKADLIGYEPQIRVHIMSGGGDVYSGFALMNILEKSRVKVITIAQGSCCSAATFMFLGGSERRMGKNAYLLIHQISTEIWGEYKDLKNEMKNCEKLMKNLKRMYMDKTDIPEKKFKKLMKKDLYLSASKCLKYNIVHAVD
jgi:ATP-dependent protease ClpP protease subunit|tara:strand:- start:567 stop:1142 length:576 start_codon:yes stop_codon:yes gene_type:complete